MAKKEQHILTWYKKFYHFCGPVQIGHCDSHLRMIKLFCSSSYMLSDFFFAFSGWSLWCHSIKKKKRSYVRKSVFIIWITVEVNQLIMLWLPKIYLCFIFIWLFYFLCVSLVFFFLVLFLFFSSVNCGLFIGLTFI